MSLSPAADYMKFGTEIMARLFTTQAVLFFPLGVATFQNIQFKSQGITQKKETTFTTRRMFKTRIQASVCVKNIIRNVFLHFGLFLKSKSRYCCECTLYSKDIVLHYWPIANKVTSFIGNTPTEMEVDFQENASKGSRDIAVLLFPCKVPFLIG